MRLVILGAGTTVKETPLLATPPTVTTTLPVVAPDGTGATIEAALQLLGLAVVPLNLTVLVPWVEPKPLPLMVIDAPTAPEFGDRALMFGVTVNLTPLLLDPPTVTTTLPVVAALGTGATIVLELQLVGVAATPLNVTVLVPWVDPKPVPVIVTEVPTGPEVGDNLLIFGAAYRDGASAMQTRRDVAGFESSPRNLVIGRRILQTCFVNNAAITAPNPRPRSSNNTALINERTVIRIALMPSPPCNFYSWTAATCVF